MIFCHFYMKQGRYTENKIHLSRTDWNNVKSLPKLMHEKTEKKIRIPEAKPPALKVTEVTQK